MSTELRQPGMYQMTAEEYFAYPAMNCSVLEWGGASMLHLKAAIDGKIVREDTDALSWGRAFHIRMLEPSLYESKVKIRGACRSILQSGPNKGKECGCRGVGTIVGDWFCGKHGGDDVSLETGIEYIDSDEAANIERAVEAVKNRKADNLRRAPGKFEVVFIGNLHGVHSKIKVDKYIENPSSIVDLKKVAAAKDPRRVPINPYSFASSLEHRGYGMRAAFYCDLVASITGNLPRWYWLVVEDGEPFAPAVYKLQEADLLAGRNEYAGLLEQYKRCLESGEWPGPADEPEEISGPYGWRKRNGVE